jgi:F-type H+-transporting ATPase subunit delta
MSYTKIARRYATALFLNATEQGLDKVLSEVQGLETTLANNANLSSMLKDAAIDSSSKAKALSKVFENSSPIIKNTLLLLCEKRREYVLDEVILEFYRIYNEHNKIVKVAVTSALPLDNATENAISNLVKEKTGANKIEMSNQIDASLMGGFVVRFGDTLIDTSINSQLNRIKKEFKIA